MKGVYVRCAGVALIAGISLGAAGAATAQQAGGLGSYWPNASDLSRAPGFHAYRWDRQGVSFIQLNNQAGMPVLAVAVSGGAAIVLPVGQPDRVKILQRPQSGGIQPAAGQVLFSDTTVEISAVSDGYQVQMLQAADEPCTDPVECGKPLITTRAIQAPPEAAANETCNDPVECGKPVQ